jgi:hypothetical protein
VASIGGDDLLTQIETQNPKLGQFLRNYVVPAISNVGTNLGASPTGFVAPPDAPQALTINEQIPEHVQFTITHTSPVQKGVKYFTEVATSPSFAGARVEDHGTSRAPVNTLFLPTMDSTGATYQYVARSYAQMPGGQRSGYSPTVSFSLTGTSKANHTPSTGSGTAAPDGSQPGQGLGNNLFRPAQAPKRSVK